MATRVSRWRELAECQYVGPELFFPEGRGDHGSGKLAKRVCAVCPVRRICLAEAMREERGLHRELRYGIRGGLTARERIELAKRTGEHLESARDENTLIGAA